MSYSGENEYNAGEVVSRTEMMAWHSREVFQSDVSRSHTVYGTIQSLLLLVVLRIISERNVTNYGELHTDATQSDALL